MIQDAAVCVVLGYPSNTIAAYAALAPSYFLSAIQDVVITFKILHDTE